MRTSFRFLGMLLISATGFSAPAYPGRFYRFEQPKLSAGPSIAPAFTSICQDREGFLWLGTSSGLARYDGYRLVYFNPGARNTSPPTPVGVFPVSLARSGDIWVGTNGRGVFKFRLETEEFIEYPSKPLDPGGPGDDIVLAVQEDRQGSLWIGTRSHGVFKFDSRANSYDLISLTPDAKVIWDILVDSQENVWVGTLDAGLFRIDSTSGVAVNYRFVPGDSSSLGSNTVWTVFEDGAGRIWAGTKGGGLNRYDPEENRFERFLGGGDFPRDLAGQTIVAIAEDEAGRLWLGTSTDGLRMWDRTTGDYVVFRHDPQDPESLSDNNITSIFRDAEGILWVGTVRGGLNKCLTGNAKFPHYKHNPSNPRSLGHSEVRTLWADGTGAIWVGTGGGLERLDEKKERPARFNQSPSAKGGLGDDKILVVTGDGRGRVWVGTETGGLDRIEPARGTVSHYRHDPANSNSLSNNRVTALCLDATRPDTLWVGTHGGLNRLETSMGRWTRFFNNPLDRFSLSNNIITAIFEDKRGSLWVGTRWGLNKLDKMTGRCERFVHRLEDLPGISIGDNTIHCILEDRGGTLWVGTDSGLNGFDSAKGVWRHFTQTEGLSGDVVCGILEDAAGSLWISTNRGLSRLEPQTEKVTHFGSQDGLQGESFNPGACFKSPDGRLYFGGTNGFNIIDPAGIHRNRFIPPVVWTAFYQENVEVKLARPLSTPPKLSLGHNAPIPVLEFAALSFAAPEMNAFACRLEPRDSEWIFLGVNNKITLTGVGAGKYTLRVKAANADGVWNETGIGIAIQVQPPVWRTWWFLLIAGAFIVSGAISVAALWRKIESLTLAPGESLESAVEFYNLTSREREILRLILQGAKNKEIGQKLFISGSTVRNHIYNIYQKLGVRNRVELLNRVAGDARKKTSK